MREPPKEFTPEQKIIYNEVVNSAKIKMNKDWLKKAYAHWWDHLSPLEENKLKKIGW